MYKNIGVAIASGVILLALGWAVNVLYKSSIHVDQNTPAVSGITQKLDESDKREDQIAAAIQALQELRIEILSREVAGQATRDITSMGRGKPRVWVNTNSDARFFKTGEEVELITPTQSTIAMVAGYIHDNRQRVLVKLSTEAAEDLGLTVKQGIEENFRIRRSEAEVKRQSTIKKKPVQRR